METRANYALIGVFTLAVIAAAFGFVYWFSGSQSGERRQPVRVVFSGSVSGLSKGSVVLFNGIRVGEVTDVGLVNDDPRRVIARIEVDRSTPVRTDTRARLEVAILSGVAQIALIGGEPNAAPLAPSPGQPLPTIFADPSDFQDMMEMARNLARRADDVLERVNNIVRDNEGTINRTLTNVERFSQALSDSSPNIDKFLAQLGQAAEKIGPLAGKLEVLATDTDELIRSVDRKQISRIVGNVEGVTQAFAENKRQISDTLQDLSTLARRLNDTVPKLDAALTSASNVLAGVDPVKVNRVMDNADRFTTALASTSGDVQKAVREAAGMTEKLNRSADRVDGLLKAAESFLGSAAGEEGKSTFASIRQAADAIRVLALNLDKRTAEITSGVTKFTGPQLRQQVESVTTGARRTLDDIGKTSRSLRENPQQLIFGGQPTLPQYNGR